MTTTGTSLKKPKAVATPRPMLNDPQHRAAVLKAAGVEANAGVDVLMIEEGKAV